ncbi:MAG: hypothetical protein WCF90_05050 [Methanomicrobiales archaeon]
MSSEPVIEKVSNRINKMLKECEDLPKECSNEPPDAMVTATPSATAPNVLALGGSIASTGSGPFSPVKKTCCPGSILLK